MSFSSPSTARCLPDFSASADRHIPAPPRHRLLSVHRRDRRPTTRDMFATACPGTMSTERRRSSPGPVYARPCRLASPAVSSSPTGRTTARTTTGPQLQLTKRLTHRWMMHGSFAYNDWKQNIDNKATACVDPTNQRLSQDPAYQRRASRTPNVGPSCSEGSSTTSRSAAATSPTSGSTRTGASTSAASTASRSTSRWRRTSTGGRATSTRRFVQVDTRQRRGNRGVLLGQPTDHRLNDVYELDLRLEKTIPLFAQGRPDHLRGALQRRSTPTRCCSAESDATPQCDSAGHNCTGAAGTILEIQNARAVRLGARMQLLTRFLTRWPARRRASGGPVCFFETVRNPGKLAGSSRHPASLHDPGRDRARGASAPGVPASRPSAAPAPRLRPGHRPHHDRHPAGRCARLLPATARAHAEPRPPRVARGPSSRAHAHNVMTLPSHANILTGLYPYEHGVRDNDGFRLDPKIADRSRRSCKAAGYATAAFIGAFPLDARFGLAHGFDLYDERYPQGANEYDFRVAERPAREVVGRAPLVGGHAGRPRFLWVHLYDCHSPYRPPSPFAAQYADDPYLGEVAGVDAALGPLLDDSARRSARPPLARRDGRPRRGAAATTARRRTASSPTRRPCTCRCPLGRRRDRAGATRRRGPARGHRSDDPRRGAASSSPPPGRARPLFPPAPVEPDALLLRVATRRVYDRGWAPLRGMLGGGREVHRASRSRSSTIWLRTPPSRTTSSRNGWTRFAP